MLDIFKTEIPQLTKREKRKVYVYVPDWEDRFPVLYMFDGHNLFDDGEATYGKSWGMLKFLEENRVPLIVVGVECNHHLRITGTGDACRNTVLSIFPNSLTAR